MFETFQRTRRSMLVATVLFLVLGVVLVGWPGLFIQFACNIIGAVLIAFGVISIIGELTQKDKSVLTIIFDLIVAAVGIAIIANPELVSSIVPVVFGLILLIDGVVNIRQAIGMHHYQESSWLMMLLLGVITLVFGVLILLHPYGTAELAFRIMGIALLYNAISDLFIITKVGHAAKKHNGQRVIDVEAHPVDDDENE